MEERKHCKEDPVQGRLAGLDGLRALAALLVVWLHASFAGYRFPPLWIPQSGKLGVSIFFVLSGYLITTLLLREKTERGCIGLIRFYVRRGLRIFPAFYAYLLFLTAAPLLMRSFPATDRSSLISSACYVINWVLPRRDHNVMQIWSLCVEEQFYLVWPLVLSRFSPRQALAISAGIFFLWPVARIARHGSSLASAGDLLVATSFDTLMLGCCLALCLHQWPDLGKRWSGQAWLPLISSGLLTSLYVYSTWLPSWSGPAIPLLRDALIAVIILWIVQSPTHWLTRLLEWSPLKFLGLLSYSLYLWHVPFLRAYGGPLPFGLWSWVGVTSATLFSFYLIERPFLRWRDRLVPAQSVNAATKI